MIENPIIRTLIVFFALVALDFIYARYTLATAKEKPFTASAWASFLPVTSGLAVMQYVDDPWMLIPAAIGAFVGTWLGMIKWTKPLE